MLSTSSNKIISKLTRIDRSIFYQGLSLNFKNDMIDLERVLNRRPLKSFDSQIFQIFQLLKRLT